jgi:hypothetical protein
MLEYVFLVLSVPAALLVAQCIGAMSEEDQADHDVWRALGGGDVEEVAGASQPYSADSFLPPHMVHDAREAIAASEEAQL